MTGYLLFARAGTGGEATVGKPQKRLKHNEADNKRPGLTKKIVVRHATSPGIVSSLGNRIKNLDPGVFTHETR